MAKKPQTPKEAPVFFTFSSPVTKRLITSQKANFLQRIREELRLVTITQNTGKALVLEIRGAAIAEQATYDLLAKLEKEARTIEIREKLAFVKKVQDQHWRELDSHFAVFIKDAKDRISSDQRTKVAAEQAAKSAVKQMTEQFGPLLKSFKKSAGTGSKSIQGAAKNGLIPLLSDYMPLNVNSALAYTALRDPDIKAAFMAGDAGGGKTITAMAAAIAMYNAGEIDNIHIFRPRTSTGKKDMGAFPGGPEGKMAPYLKGGINNNLIKLTGLGLDHFISKGIIIAATPDLERGETHDRTCMIIDEAQNLTVSEAELLERRMGEGAKMVFTGDFAGQNDLFLQEPGLVRMIVAIGHNVKQDLSLAKAYAFIRYTEEDSKARNPLLTSIINAHKNLPDEYRSLQDAFNETDRHTNRAKALENMKNFASKIMEEPALTTAKRFTPAAQKRFPAMFEQGQSNVVKMPTRQIS